MSNAFAIILHLLAINIWIGGTFFGVVVLPRAVASLEPWPQHQFMHHLLRRFFYWVWLAMLVLLTSGGWMIYNVFSGLAYTPIYVLVMMIIALLMMVVFLWVFFVPYRHYQQAYEIQNISGCQQQLAIIRRLSQLNMGLGFCVVLVIGGGPHFLV